MDDVTIEIASDIEEQVSITFVYPTGVKKNFVISNLVHGADKIKSIMHVLLTNIFSEEDRNDLLYKLFMK